MVNFRDSYFQVDWDLTSKRLKGTYWGKQYDTGRGFAVTVINGGQVVAPTTEVLRLKWEKPDNTIGYVNATIVNGKFIVENIDQMFTVQGSVRADFELSVAGEFVASITFYVNVEKAVAVDAIESSSDFTALQVAIATADNIDAQLAQKTDKGNVSVSDINKNLGLLDETYMTDRFKEQIAGTTPIGSTPPDRSITLDKLAFVKTGKNLFDKTKTVKDVAVSATDGSLVNVSTFTASDYIAVKPNTTYTRSHEHSMAFYDSNKAFISGVTGSDDVYTFTTTPNTYFIRSTVASIYVDVLQIELGEESTPYEEYSQLIGTDYLEGKPFDPKDIPDGSIAVDKTTFFEPGKNLLDKTKVSLKTGLSSTTGETDIGGTFNDERFTTDYIAVEAEAEYTRNFKYYTVAFYDENMVFISGLNTGSLGINTFTTPVGTKFLRASFRMTELDSAQIEKGGTITPYEKYRISLKREFLNVNNEDIPKEFKAEFTTTKINTGINVSSNNLYLIATKKKNDGAQPIDEGYLYLDEVTQKLYYSSNTFNDPNYLCDWDSTLVGGAVCEDYHATITNDGDIIFFKSPYNNTVRTNPVIYPSHDYNSPLVIDFGTETKPFGFAVDNGIEHHTEENYFILAEYRGWNVADDDTPIYIWKVTKPYADPSSWKKVDMWYVRHYNSGPGPNPTREISHFHTANYDFFSGAWLASTGDTQGCCRVLMSTDKGETWVDQQAGDGDQMVRMVGFIFTKDEIYWQTDSTGSNHKLYKVGRDANGYPDFSNIIKVTDLSSTGEAGYVTAYMRNPHGLLFIDRAEPRMDGLCDLYFYSLEFENLFHIGIFERVNGDNEGRHGLPPLAYTRYQSPFEDGIIMGATTKTKPFTLNILNNEENNLLGVLKMKVVKVR